MSKKRVTIMDIAREADVDYSTVSLALRGNSRIRVSTRIKIEAIAKKLGYMPNQLARSLSGGGTRVIGIMLTDMQRFLADPLEEMQSLGEKAGYTVAPHFSWWNEGREHAGLRKFCETCAEGIVWAPANGQSEQFAEMIKELHQFRIPTVVLGFMTDRKNAFCHQVGVDMKKALRIGLEYLVEKGHRKIAIATASRMVGMRGVLHRKRLELARELFAELGLTLLPENIFDTADNEHGGIDIAVALASRPRKRWPTVIYAFDDLLSRGLAKGLNALKVSIPTDINILGYDVAPDEPMGPIPLTTVCIETRILAQWAIEVLFREIGQKIAPDSYEYQEVPCRVVEGRSVNKV